MKESPTEPRETVVARTPVYRIAGRLPLLLALALAALANLHAMWPLKDLVRHWNDFAFVFAAGRTWLKGGSPYDVALWRSQWADIYPSFAGLTPPVLGAPSQPYLYPPHWAIIAVPIGYLPWHIACRIWDCVNVVAYLGIAVLTYKLLPATTERYVKKAGFWFCVAIMASNGAVRWTFWECQLSMLPTLGVVGAYFAWVQRRQGWVAVCVFLALLKPQIGLLPVTYLALIGAIRGVVGGGSLAVAVGAISMLHVDWRALPQQLEECAQLHMSIAYNALDNFYSLSSLLANFGSAAFASQLLGFAVIAAMAWRARTARKRAAAATPPLTQLAVACAIGAAFIPLHGYDLVILTPLAFWAYTLPQAWLKGLVFLLIVSASRAHTWGTLHGVHPLGPWVTIALFCLSLYAWSLESDRKLPSGQRA